MPPPAATRPPLKVLFIGNSLTYRNCLSNVLALLAMSAASPRQIRTDQVTVGAATLRELLKAGAAIAKIHEQNIPEKDMDIVRRAAMHAVTADQ